MQVVNFSDQEFELHSCGGIFWPSQKIYIISDLHFEKGSSYSPFGSFLPPYDTSETLEKLAYSCEKIRPETILFLGDVYHDKMSESRMNKQDWDAWNKILTDYQIIWVEGNHDPNSAPENIDNHIEYKREKIHFRHVAENDTFAEISGHYHPVVEINHKQQKIRRPCFIVSENKIILPSYGTFTGGLNVEDDAFAELDLVSRAIYPIGNNKVYRYK